MILWTALLYGLAVGCSWTHGAIPQPQLSAVKQWNLLTYNFDWNAPVNDKDFFNPENVVATGLAVSQDRIFVATPRLFSGVPATVSSIPRDQFGDSPALQAYPNWSFHAAGLRNYNCSDLGLVSVYRLRIDSCNRLWALDAGVSRSLEDYEITCPPKILVFDLATDQVVRRIDFPREVRRGESLYTNLIIDETTSKPENKCDDVFVYISDTVEPAIVVYDSAKDLTWRVSHPSMFPDPDFAESQIQGYKFVLMDGIVGLGFDAKAGLVYFQPLATDRLFSISTDALRAGPFPRNEALPVKLVGKKSSQGIGLSVSPADGSIFFGPLTETALASWNPITNEQKVLAYDPEALQFIADMSLAASDPSGLYVVSSKFHRFFLKNVNRNEVNTRILRIDAIGFQPNSQQFPPTSFPNGFDANQQQVVSQRPQHPFAHNTDYFRSIGQPYQFQGAGGYSNKGVSNTFTALNAGEQIGEQIVQQLTTVVPSTSYATFSQRPFVSDFKNERYIKRASFNSKVVHQ